MPRGCANLQVLLNPGVASHRKFHNGTNVAVCLSPKIRYTHTEFLEVNRTNGYKSLPATNRMSVQYLLVDFKSSVSILCSRYVAYLDVLMRPLIGFKLFNGLNSIQFKTNIRNGFIGFIPAF